MTNTSEYMREYRRTHPEYRKKQSDYNKKRYQEHREEKAKEVQIIKQTVRNNLGNKCTTCGITEKLQLHHKFYAEDSVKPQQHSFNRFWEAFKHPERFKLLCPLCHKKEHHPVYSTNKDAVYMRQYRARKRLTNSTKEQES